MAVLWPCALFFFQSCSCLYWLYTVQLHCSCRCGWFETKAVAGFWKSVRHINEVMMNTCADLWLITRMANWPMNVKSSENRCGNAGGGVFFLVPGTKRHIVQSECLSLCLTYSGVILMSNDHIVKVGLCAQECVRLKEVLYAGVLWVRCWQRKEPLRHIWTKISCFFSPTRPLCCTCTHTPVDGSQLMGELVDCHRKMHSNARVRVI